MKQAITFIFTISLLFLDYNPVSAQVVVDTISYKERYGIRVGVDLSKPIRTLLEEDYSGVEIMGDYRVYKNYYIAAELGNEKIPFDGDNIRVSSSGSYIKLGVDYNAYENWAGMENMIFAGLRYGFATFSQTLEEYNIFAINPFFPPTTIEGPVESSGLTANWLEFIIGLKVEVLPNLYLGGNVQLKSMISQVSPSNMDNLVVPGFNRTNDISSFGVGYSYNISYLIPLFRRANN